MEQGVFTASRQILCNHSEIIDSALAPNRGQFLKLIIPQSLKPGFLWRLRGMNIAANALFPGLDGTARSMAELVRIRAGLPRMPAAPAPEDAALTYVPIAHAPPPTVTPAIITVGASFGDAGMSVPCQLDPPAIPPPDDDGGFSGLPTPDEQLR